jgi:hypothetical protein
MLRLEVKTRLSHEKAAERIRRFFGKEGLGLDITEETPQCLSFEGGGGYVTATVCPEEGTTRVTLQTQEWDEQVKKFSSTLP